MITAKTRALLAFVAQHEPIRAFDAFSRFDGAGEHETTFAHRLNHLGDRGLLVNTGKTGRAVWSTTALARRQLMQMPPPGADAIVPPRQVNVMNTPVYQPAPATHYRAGAFDFAACPSLTAGGPTPFTGATS
ncbi:MAG: hypothetical protein B7Y42_00390 [Polaromonas sp. 28-63-22]|jgi:hypothetical protein|nr:MAG: hypothetical protein B7Y42_00390 [Polaromonas sp. 28-63-22]